MSQSFISSCGAAPSRRTHNDSARQTIKKSVQEFSKTYSQLFTPLVFPARTDNVRAGMNKTVIEVQVRAVLPTSGGGAGFFLEKDKGFIFYFDLTVVGEVTMFLRVSNP